MKFPIIGGVVFVLSGIAALSAVALRDDADTTPSAVIASASEEVVFSVPDMHCEFACAPKVRETLAAVPGVEKVETDVETQTATVVTGDRFDEAKALAALSEAGYPAERAAN